jgi:uncharacterized phage infection (PIP) family protein YhgE
VLTRLGLGGLIVLLVAFVIGCGGDDDSSSGDDSSTAAETSTGDTTTTAEEPEVTQEDFVKEADKLCKSKVQEIAKTLTESNKAQAAANTPETLASLELVSAAADKVADVTDHLADMKREITKELSKLDTPNQKELDQLVKSREAAAKDLDELADAWRAYGKNPTQTTSDNIAKAQQANAKSAIADRHLAEKMGLKVCGAAIKPA